MCVCVCVCACVCVLFGPVKQELGVYIYIYIYDRPIGLIGRVFANGPGDLGLIPGRVITKTKKFALDTSSLNIQHFKVRINGKVEQSRECGSTLPNTSV